MPEILHIPEHPQADPGEGANEGEQTGNGGRGREDHVYRLRALVWFSVVRAHKKAPWEPAAMDRHFLGQDGGDGRAFWRVLRYARDPGQPRPRWAGMSLVDRVAATRGFEHTAQVYRSPLWEDVLGSAPLTPARREALIEATLARLGLFEPTEDDRLAEVVLALGLQALKAVPARVLRQRIAQVARTRSIDAILLLCLYYRRAIEETRLEDARAFADGTLAAIGRFCRRPGVLGGVDAMWTFMTRRRVLAGQRGLDHSPRIQRLAETWLAPRRARAGTCTPAARAAFEAQAWQLGCVLDNDARRAPSSAFHPRTPELECYLAERATFIARAYAQGSAEAIARAERAAAARPTRAQRAFADQPGAAAWTPPEWE